MRLLMRLLLLLLVLAVLLCGLAFVLPDRAHVERSATIARPPSQIYLLLTDLHRFNAWSPWLELDPDARYSFSGPDSGVGATLAWSSRRSDAGSGSQTIIAAVPQESITVALDFGEMGTPKAHFALRDENGDTRITWNLDMELPLHLDHRFGWNVLGRYMGVFMDRMAGPDFERGLAKLKQLAESFPNGDVAGIAPQVIDLPARRVIYVAVATDGDEAATLRAWNAALTQLTRFAVQHGLSTSGGALTLSRQRDAGTWRFDLALSTHYDVMPEDTAVRGREIEAMRVVQLSHDGSLAERIRFADKLRTWALVKGLPVGDLLIEEYQQGADALRGTVLLSIPLQPAAR